MHIYLQMINIWDVHGSFQNVKKARNILLGAPKWSQFDYMPCQGLFYERKPNKFFQVILFAPHKYASIAVWKEIFFCYFETYDCVSYDV